MSNPDTVGGAPPALTGHPGEPDGAKPVAHVSSIPLEYRGVGDHPSRILVIGLVILIVIGIGAAATPLILQVLGNDKHNGEAQQISRPGLLPAVLIREDRTVEELRGALPGITGAEIAALQRDYGLRLTKEAVAGLQVDVATAYTPQEPLALAPQPGTVNYDNDRLFILKSRFQGEVGVLKQVLDLPAPMTALRPIRYGDTFPQGELLAVVWSQALGQTKAALVDAVCALRLSKNQLDRYEKLYQDGALPLAVYKTQERQVQGDSGAVLTAKRSLKMWRLTDPEIEEIEAEANKIIDLKLVRNADYEKKWAEVYITVPKVPGQNYEMVLVEKNTNLHDMVDPTTIMFKLADLSRLTIWVQPPEEYALLVRDRLKKGQALKWQIQFQADPPGTKPLDLPILQIAPSMDPNVHTPMVMGYLPNADKKYIIGQFVTATMFIPPDPDTVAIPTNAINVVEGQMVVFVEKDANKREYMLRRVAVEHRFQRLSFVRSKLTEQDEKLSEVEKAKGRWPIEALRPGERVLTNGIVQLTAALDTLLAKDRQEKQQQQGQ